jgi:hypothetical protein
MKLTYRGNAYVNSASVPFNADSQDQAKIKLIYRGYTYSYTLHSVESELTATDTLTTTLTYRGNTYQRQLQRPQLSQQPREINWRYQAGEG